MPAPPESAGFQLQFRQRWGHLHDPHVRTLAWLLDAPDLLDAAAPCWQGRIASIGPLSAATADWLAALDRAPAELHAFLDIPPSGIPPFTRLGRYAEKLLAFYLHRQGRLVAHGLQVRVGAGTTIGEFDFLLRDGMALVHWEFATKLYLLEPNGDGRHADYFVGPNLADTLGAKIGKIMDRQLALSTHPAAQAVLPEPVAAAQALVKGWLFYHGATPPPPSGVSGAHCRGFWCTLDELRAGPELTAAILPRLDWLAPARLPDPAGSPRDVLAEQLDARFAGDRMPQLVALLAPHDGWMVEIDRGFVVPNDWRGRAGRRTAEAGTK